MADFIDGAIYKIKSIVKHGSPKHLRKKLKAKVLAPLKDDIPDVETEEKCKTASEHANNPVAKLKKEISDKVRKDLGLNQNN